MRPVNVFNFVSGDRILDDIAENASEEVGDVVDEWLQKVPNEKARELEQLIADWIVANFPPTFWHALNATQHFRKDYPDAEQFDDHAG